MQLLWFIVLPLLLSPALPALYATLGRRGVVWLLTGGMAALFAGGLLMLPQVSNGDVITANIVWAENLGLSFSFYLDGLALLFVSLVTGVGIAVFYYAGQYFDTDEEMLRFYRWLLIFAGSMLWVVLAGNLIALFIAWELTSISSFMLIGFKGAKYADARKGAMQALMITGGGGLALIVGLLLIGTAVGSMEFTEVLNTSLVDHPWYAGIVALMALGAFTKSAQFPFHFWLPGAMAAPSPASAFLHSATMVKAGIYLMARFYPTLGGSVLWESLLVTVGLATLLFASMLALKQRDLKGILAYTTIAQLGALTALIGLPDYNGFKALMVGILAHALYKAPLFLSAGIIDHATGTRIVDELGGLWQKLRGTGYIFLLACISMAGVIPFMGFVGKETLLEAFIDQPGALGVIVVSAVLTVAVAILLVRDVFFVPEPEAAHADAYHDEHHHFHQPDRALLYGPMGLALVGSVTGLLLDFTITPLITPAVPKEFSLYLFPGFNLAFTLSTIAIFVGVIVYMAKGLWLRPVLAMQLPSAAGFYNAIVAGVEWFGDQLIRTQNGKLRYYLIVILGSVAGLMVASGLLLDLAEGQAFNIEFRSAADVLGAVLVVLTIGAAAGSIIFKSHLTAALSLAVMGYAIGGIFLLQPAPDVALVQFLVETLGTVLVIIMIGRISRSQRLRAVSVLWDTSRGGVWRDIIIATVIGFTVGLFALTAITNRPERETIATWHLENAYPETGVVDVVSAIIADFRATDTLVEIMVFGMAALGVLTLMTVSRESRNASGGVSPAIDIAFFDTPLARRVAQIVLPVALMISMTHLLYAGDGPGDGFTAGVIGGLAIALWYVIFGYNETKRRLPWLKPWWLITVGFTMALVNATLPLLFGREFFAITKIEGLVPPAGLHIASTLIFETGIFLAVFGGTSVIMEAIAHPEGVSRMETQEMAAINMDLTKIEALTNEDGNGSHQPQPDESEVRT